MSERIFEIIFSFETGEQKIFSDVSKTLTIQDNYNYDELLSPNQINNTIEEDYFSLISISNNTITNNTNDYISFKNFGDSIVAQLQKNDKISNIIIKDSYGNVYYNLLPNDIIGINLGGLLDYGNPTEETTLLFKILIYCKKGE